MRGVVVSYILQKFQFVVSVATSCDVESNISNSFSLSLNISLTPEIKITKTVKKSGEEVTEQEY